MMMDIVQAVRAAFSREAVPALSRMLEEPPKKVQAAVGASIPSVMLLLSGKAAESGAQGLLETVNERGPAVMDHVAQQVRDGEAQVHSALGMRKLNQLLGRDSAEGLAYAVSRFSGLAPDSARVIVGLAAVACLEGMGRHIAPRDTGSLAAYLAGRQAAYAAAVPAGMFEYLEAVPPLRALTHRRGEPGFGSTPDHAAAAQHEDDVLADDLQDATGAERAPAAMAWAIPILIVLAIGAAMVFTLYPRNANSPITVARPVPPAQPLEEQAQPAGSQLPGATTPFGISDLAYLDNTALRTDLTQAFARLSAALQGVRDAQTAANASAELREVSQLLRRSETGIASLPADTQARLMREVDSAMPGILQALDTAAVQPGGDAVLPAAQQVVQQLRQISSNRRS